MATLSTLRAVPSVPANFDVLPAPVLGAPTNHEFGTLKHLTWSVTCFCSHRIHLPSRIRSLAHEDCEELTTTIQADEVAGSDVSEPAAIESMCDDMLAYLTVDTRVPHAVLQLSRYAGKRTCMNGNGSSGSCSFVTSALPPGVISRKRERQCT